MIHFVTGKPGGGKSYYSLRQIVEDLAKTERWIVTNLPIVLEELAEYLHNRYPEPIDIRRRIRLLSDDEVRDFWRHYPGFDLPGTTEEIAGMKAKAGKTLTDFSKLNEIDYPGTLFVIDEVHLHFSARQWQSIGDDCELFMSQHRKLKSDVLLVTQHSEKVDKNMRRNAQDFTVLRNMETERMWLGVTFKKRLRRQTYLHQPSRMDTPMESGWFQLDVSGLAKCYNTAAGVGIAGRLDVRENHRGGSWVRWVLVIGILAVIGFLIPKGLGALSRNFVQSATGVGAETIRKSVGVADVALTDAQAAKIEQRVYVKPEVVYAKQETKVNEPVPYGEPGWVGIAALGRVDGFGLGTNQWWQLTDGRILRPSTPGVSSWGEGWVLYRGQLLEYFK